MKKFLILVITLMLMFSTVLADVEMTYPVAGSPAGTGPCTVTNRQTPYMWNNSSFVVAAFGFSTTSTISSPTDATRLILNTDVDGLRMFRFSSNRQTVIIHPGESTTRMSGAPDIGMNLAGDAKYARYPHVVLREKPLCYQGMYYPETEDYAPPLTSANINAATGAVTGQADYYSAAAWYPRDTAPLLVDTVGAARQHPTQLWVGTFDMPPGTLCKDAINPADYSGAPTVKQALPSALGYHFAPNNPAGQGVPYTHTSGVGPGGLMWAMSCAFGQEFLGYDMRYPFAIGCQETGLGLFYDSGGGMTDWQYAPGGGYDGGGDGQYQMIDADCQMTIASFPDYYPVPNSYSNTPAIVPGMRGNPVLSTMAILLDMSSRYYGYFSASRAIRLGEFAAAASDAFALVKIAAVGFNKGPHAPEIQQIYCGTAERASALTKNNLCLAGGAAAPIMGFNYYGSRIVDLMRRIGTETTVYDWGMTWGDVTDYLADMRGTHYANGAPTNAQWTAMTNDLQAAFNLMRGKVPAPQWPTGYNANTISYRYNWLTMLRIMKTYLPNPHQVYPKGHDFNEVDFIDQYIPTGSEETKGLCTPNNTAPEVYWITPRHVMPTIEQAFPVIPDVCNNVPLPITADVLDNDIGSTTVRYAISPGNPDSGGQSMWLDGEKTGGTLYAPVATNWVTMTNTGASVSPAGGRRFSANYVPGGITGKRRVYIEANDNCGWRTITWVDVDFKDCSSFTPTPTPCVPNVALTKGHDPINCFPNAGSIAGYTGGGAPVVSVGWESSQAQTSDSVGALKASWSAKIWSGYILQMPTGGNLTGYNQVCMNIKNTSTSAIGLKLTRSTFGNDISTNTIMLPALMSNYVNYCWTLTDQAAASTMYLMTTNAGPGLDPGDLYIDEIDLVTSGGVTQFDPRCCPPLTTYTITPTITRTATPTITRTNTPTATQTATRTYTQTFTPSSTYTSTPTVTYTATQTATRTNTQTFTPSLTVTNTPTMTQTATPTASRTATPTMQSTYTHTETMTPSATRTATQTVQPSGTLTFTKTVTETATASMTYTATQSNTPTMSYTQTATQSSTNTPQFTATVTPSISPTSTITPAFTHTITYTVTETATPTGTRTITITVTDTATPTGTRTITLTNTPTCSATATKTITETSTDTPVFTKTVTPSVTITSTYTFTVTVTYTVTMTPTPEPGEISVDLTALDTTTTYGGTVELVVTIRNNGSGWARGISLTDILPDTVDFEISGSSSGWTDASGTLTLVAGDLAPGGVATFVIVIKVKDEIPTDTIDIQPVTAVYTNDTNPGIPETRVSAGAQIKIGEIQIYPNPFNPSKAVGGKMKFMNVPKGTRIIIYTISGEKVNMWQTRNTSSVMWDGKNMFEKDASAGIYYYVITNENKQMIKSGKIFISR